MNLHGILIVDKPAGMTSHDVVNRVRRLFGTKRVGHTGTLDPEATGVLVLCVGNATRLAEYLSAEQKSYSAAFTFGVETDTQDIWGETTAEYDASGLTQAELDRVLPAFRGTIYQVPPMVSARRHDGKHLYELARKGVTVARDARRIEIYSLEITRFLPGARPVAEIEVTCSAGTYVRTLAFDMGSSTGVGAAMSGLRRTAVGSGLSAFTLAHAHNLDRLTTMAETGSVAEALLPLSAAVRGWTQVRLDAGQENRIRNGQPVALDDVLVNEIVSAGRQIALQNSQGELVAIARVSDTGELQPEKVLRQDGP